MGLSPQPAGGAPSGRRDDARVVLLAGGTGGAKLARGLLDVIAGPQLTVIANTGDDIDIYGAHVSPDPDLVSFWLADCIDDRGWGLRDDTFTVMEALRELGHEVWFNLGDRDLAWCLERRRLIDDGDSPTAAHARLTGSLGLQARVLPMSDQPVRTWVRSDGQWLSFQEFMIRRGGHAPVDGVEFRGAPESAPSAEVLDAIGAADAIIVGPSNPVALDRPDPGRPGCTRRARRRPSARRRRQPDRRRRGAQGPDGRVPDARRASP